jgi:multisubunit Na+/H+ antiporter MnhE subunit
MTNRRRSWADTGRWLAALELLARFLVSVPLSGLATLRVILAGARRPPAGFVRVRVAPLGENGIALLGCLITLTPGSTTIDFDAARGELLLHLLDASEPEATVRDIRRRFEAPLCRLLGQEPPR